MSKYKFYFQVLLDSEILLLSPFSTLNIPISEGGANLCHTHNLAKSQSYRGLKLLLSDT